ncbi:bifunctional diaminohydroxyphosphoribosylaminopyrimidine deaminase/5-amino-6-(5-phosphoribosylamino)uracil reductase RibD [Demequina sp. TTPB684]|uniref:bifunctional diaminohydroxyphosphoribosylaminopyrimidine deaminase/5-amino-6-(5-phosphoribosylamino)uracil reductase RibD n=1 Tax=unclassified Demequina TaxID=2620311 RepID=UPI001CF10FC8|nr:MULTISPECIES: bifunctional diaminohydroxyphosphoribosylaminopyrimidine deaminase/5-amino-6-(5-phosphoribosylamino)uracil reductase RibD [unclassified Demequina]MCB2413103.1 bifunctional diaminohydroxyphosphoribosylaminopyrimidine deaminase/5-amino-6-(5-phosphoribosylamino)uracil reductase RibD [Demequina sp. TTPB684]UPU89266.1 bifunctional diaminohydroxyphosphoribosylaminopyrimidine deaminase/5-amino-6-(5-phosphoribosylamino)uracil reductase RibD [Demequina sp. TMPB413]
MNGPVDDAQAMDLAASLAALGPAHGPNPRVGAVIVRPDGRVIGEGFHRGAGTAHAEVAAIEAARGAGEELAGSTAYVTLEPCNHTGRTGPCTDALTNAGVSRVVYAVADPNPEAGGGAATLRSRGIDASLAPHATAEALNMRWLSSLRLGRPHVIAKWAQTLDGKIAAADGTSFWITGNEARDHAHHTRASVDALLVGTGTVIADDPELSARPSRVSQPHQPLRAIMGLSDTSGAKVWRDNNAIAVTTRSPEEALDALAAREVRTVVVEGGGKVLTAFLRAGLVDELHVYVAPALLGSGIPAIWDLGIGTMTDALRGRDVTITPLGVDCLVTAMVTKGK